MLADTVDLKIRVTVNRICCPKAPPLIFLPVNYIFYLVTAAKLNVCQHIHTVKRDLKDCFGALLQLIEAGSRWQCLFSQGYRMVEKCFCV